MAIVPDRPTISHEHLALQESKSQNGAEYLHGLVTATRGRPTEITSDGKNFGFAFRAPNGSTWLLSTKEIMSPPDVS